MKDTSLKTNNSRKDTIISRKILRIIWNNFPFITVLLIIALVVFPLAKKITAKKAELEKHRTREAGAEKHLTNVMTLEMAPELLVEKISLPGVVKPWISLEVVSEVKGKVVKKIEQGTPVKKGDVLAVIDKRDYQNSYNSALASYKTALLNEKRFSALSGKKFVTQSQMDDAAAQVKTTRAAMNNAGLNLERCTIRSPMKGIVDLSYIEKGSFLNVGDPVVNILQLDKLKVEVGIPESDVDVVRNLSTFDMTIDALGGQTFQGRYHYLHKSADSMARLYNLEIQLDNPTGRILPDMFARVVIIKNKDPQGLAVPLYALISQKNRTGVFVEKEGIVGFRPVTTGFQDGWKTQVPQGLLPGENVVVVGQRMIEHGEKVNVTDMVNSLEDLTP